MLEEKEFVIRKAIGWVLHKVAKSRPGLAGAWLAPRLRRAPRVFMREAPHDFPAADRDALFERCGAMTAGAD